jgi:predicted transcriptional regulator
VNRVIEKQNDTSFCIYIIEANMKTIDVRQLDEKDEEIADALISLGMKRPAARTLTYLQNLGEATSYELERGTGLHQPEISVAAKNLKEQDWIKEREEKKPGKGRPYKVLSLKIGFNEIVAQLEEQQKTGFEEAQLKIRRLKELRQ